MKNNMGSADRIIRVIVAAILIALYFTTIITGMFGIILIALSVIFILTSVISYCPLYLPFGVSTLREKRPAKFRLLKMIVLAKYTRQHVLFETTSSNISQK